MFRVTLLSGRLNAYTESESWVDGDYYALSKPTRTHVKFGKNPVTSYFYAT
jgi:hypothetical protein